MWLADLVTPVSSTDWNDGKLGQNDGTTDSGGNFLGALHSEANVTIRVANSWKNKEICCYVHSVGNFNNKRK